MQKPLYILLGTITLILGLLGLVTPGLPTTPLILLTGFLYAKASPSLYRRLENNRLTGMYLKGMKDGLSWKVRIVLLLVMWTMVLFTAFFIFTDSAMRYVMLAAGAIGTVSQLLFIKKKQNIPKNETENQTTKSLP
jgi:uncharacterized membrane protein YbaN (DUF454 family)